MPPITPEPSNISQNWCSVDAERRDQPCRRTSTRAATTPALRGPTRSSQPPHSAAEQPRKTKNSVYIQPSVAMLPVAAGGEQLGRRSSTSFGAGRRAVLDADAPCDSGSQNTEKP